MCIRDRHPQVLVQPGQRVIRRPGGAELPALGDPGRHRNPDRQRRPPPRQRRHLARQQIRELLPPHPVGQGEPTHRRVARRRPPPIARVLAAVRAQPCQSLQEQALEVLFEVLDRHMGLRHPALGQVHRPHPHLVAVHRDGLLVRERHRTCVLLIQRPPVQTRQDAHVLVPGGGCKPRFHRADRPVHGVRAQAALQLRAGVEEADAPFGQKHGPVPRDSGIGLPRARRRTTERREFLEPPVEHRCGTRASCVFEAEVLVDQYRHALGDGRLARQPPGLPVGR